MIKNKPINAKKGNNLTDKVYTPENIAKLVISKFDLYGKVLEPFRGKGAFYNNINIDKDWCEIDEGIDFFDYKEHVDWIVSNPPYSIYNEVMKHSFEIADNIVYLVPLSKIVSSLGRIKDIKLYGGIPYMFILSASKCGFPFGFPAAAVYFKKDYKGPTTIEMYEGE